MTKTSLLVRCNDPEAQSGPNPIALCCSPSVRAQEMRLTRPVKCSSEAEVKASSPAEQSESIRKGSPTRQYLRIALYNWPVLASRDGVRGSDPVLTTYNPASGG